MLNSHFEGIFLNTFIFICEGFHGWDLMVVFFGLFGHVLKAVLPNVSPVSVADRYLVWTIHLSSSR